jgi:hypothetical protein
VYITYEDDPTSSSGPTLQDLDNSPYGKCEIISKPELFEQLKISRLSAPTDAYRVALVGRDYIEVWPQDTSYVYHLHYYSLPGSFSYNQNNNTYAYQQQPPSYSASLLEGVEIFDTFNSRNFHLPPSYENELVSEIASMIGLNLRDTEVQAYSQENTVAE